MSSIAHENCQHSRRGRKPADESQAATIRQRLIVWRQTPEEQRVSLRALARELGTSEQLLSFYLKGLDRWQRGEYFRKAGEIRGKGVGMTYADEQQALAYERAAFATLVEPAFAAMLRAIEADLGAGNRLNRQQLRIVSLAARHGIQRGVKIKQDLARRGLVLQ